MRPYTTLTYINLQNENWWVMRTESSGETREKEHYQNSSKRTEQHRTLNGVKLIEDADNATKRIWLIFESDKVKRLLWVVVWASWICSSFRSWDWFGGILGSNCAWGWASWVCSSFISWDWIRLDFRKMKIINNLNIFVWIVYSKRFILWEFFNNSLVFLLDLWWLSWFSRCNLISAFCNQIGEHHIFNIILSKR